MPELVVLTSASGKQCTKIIPRLISSPGYTLRLVSSRQASVERLKAQYPQAEVVLADISQPQDVTRVVDGATVVYHVGPSFHPQETLIGYYVIQACSKLPNFKHFVYSSVIHTQIRKLPNHDSKRYVEECLIESDLNWTILKPTRFHDTLPVGSLVEQFQRGEQPVFNATWDPDTIMCHIALDDLAEATIKVIAERERHFYAEYPLCSGNPVSNRQLLAELEKQLGTEIKINILSLEDAVKSTMTAFYGDVKKSPVESREQVSRMLLHYQTRGLLGNPNILRWLLEREPVQNGDWIRHQIHKVSINSTSSSPASL